MTLGAAELVSSVLSIYSGVLESPTEPPLFDMHISTEVAYFSSVDLFSDQHTCALTLQLQDGFHSICLRKVVEETEQTKLLKNIPAFLAFCDANQALLGFSFSFVPTQRGEERLIVCSQLALSEDRSRMLDEMSSWLKAISEGVRLWRAYSSVLVAMKEARDVQLNFEQARLRITHGSAKIDISCTFRVFDKPLRVVCKLRTLRFPEALRQSAFPEHELIRVQLKVHCSFKAWDAILSDGRSEVKEANQFIKVLNSTSLDFGVFHFSFTYDFIFSTEVLLEVHSLSGAANTAESFILNTRDAIASLPMLRKVGVQAPLPFEREQPLSAESVSLHVSFEDAEQADSSRNRLVVRFLKSEQLYFPPESLRKAFFFPWEEVKERNEIYLEIEIGEWEKVYKQRPINLTDVRSFIHAVYESGLRPSPFPWSSTYWRNIPSTSPPKSEFRFVPRFPFTALEQEVKDESVYVYGAMESLTQLISRRFESNILMVPEERKILPSAFANDILDSPERVIGKGGFGIVYMNVLGSEKVAIKGPNPQREYNRKSVDNELRLMRQIDHENIVKVLGITTYKEKVMIVLERCEISLAQFIKRTKDLPSEDQMSLCEKLELLGKVADVIAFMHDKDVCHFDVKPQNILLKTTKGGIQEPKLSDFGMATQQRIDGTWKKPGYSLGYSSPEQLQGYKLGPHCDVWAFALTAYHFLFNQPPYHWLKVPNDKNEKKVAFLVEVCANFRKPRFDPAFEAKNSRLTFLLRQCWHSDPFCRPKMKEVVRKLKALARELRGNV